MLYLEDYLEMIENVPMEMRDRFTEMREMDLQVQNAMDSLDDQVKNFFKRCQTGQLKPDGKDEQYDSIKQSYSKALEDADEKVQLANQIYDLVDRYLRKLDQEVAKFKMELEADNAGITELLERRSLELDVPPPTHNNHKAEKRKHSAVLGNNIDKRTPTEKVLSNLAAEAAREAIGAHRSATLSSSLTQSSSLYTSAAAPISYNLARVGGVGSNPAIQAAASRAIGATLEMSQGRRTSSLKASYDALTRGTDVTKDLTFTPEPVRPATSISTPPPSSDKASSRTKKSGGRASQQQAAAAAVAQIPSIPVPPSVEDEPLPMEFTDVIDDTTQGSTWSYDPNEPRYCICNDVSYGEMVGCDNEDCPIEWFHYGCVGLTQAPKGKWFCPQCTAAMRRRGRK